MRLAHMGVLEWLAEPRHFLRVYLLTRQVMASYEVRLYLPDDDGEYLGPLHVETFAVDWAVFQALVQKQWIRVKLFPRHAYVSGKSREWWLAANVVEWYALTEEGKIMAATLQQTPAKRHVRTGQDWLQAQLRDIPLFPPALVLTQNS